VKPISVPLVADSDKSERVERFFVNLSEPVNAKLADPQGSGFILEKDYDLKRVKPRGFTASTSPKQDTTNPFRFTTSGRLIRPSGLSRALACKGKVSVQIKAVPRKTISTRRVNVRRDCTYRSVVTFTERSRFPESGELEIHARFLGNTVLLPRKARTHKVDTNG
jgi:hypothetical protein